MKYNLYTYDLIGNETDGFEVNDVFLNTSNIELDECDLETSQSLFEALKSKGLVNDSVIFERLDFDYCEDYTIYINYENRPDCELRPII